MPDTRALTRIRNHSRAGIVLGLLIFGVLLLVGACSSGRSSSNGASQPDDPPVANDDPPVANDSEFLKGADLSYLNTVWSNGAEFANTSGTSVDPYAFFAQRGADLVRMRLWHTPENVTDFCGNPIETNNLDDVVTGFQRASRQGMDLLLSIHYGDYFNDPGRQLMPIAWQSHCKNHLLVPSSFAHSPSSFGGGLFDVPAFFDLQTNA